jgi:hypothetical protein
VFAIDLKGAPATGAVADWLNVPHLTRSIGAVYSESPSDAFFAPVNLHSFDVIFFVNRTTAAHENPRQSEIEFRGGP